MITTFSHFSDVITAKQGNDTEGCVKGGNAKVTSEKRSETSTNFDAVSGQKSDNVLNRRRKRIHLVTKPADVWIHREGRIHEATFFDSNNSASDRTSNGKET